MNTRISFTLSLFFICLAALPAQPPAPFSWLKGKVVDKSTQLVLANVSIEMIGAKNFHAESASDGSFKIRIPNLPAIAKFQIQGYMTKEFEVTKIPKYGEAIIIELQSDLKNNTPNIPDGFANPALFNQWKIIKLKSPSGKIIAKNKIALSEMAMVLRKFENQESMSKGKIAFHDGCNKGYISYFTVIDEFSMKLIEAHNIEEGTNECDDLANEIKIFKEFVQSLSMPFKYKLKSSNSKLKIKSGPFKIMLSKKEAD